MKVLILIIGLSTGLISSTWAYTFDDAILDIVDDGSSYETSIEYLGLFRILFSDFRCDPKTTEFFDFWVENLKKFYLNKIYNSDYLHDGPDGYRIVGFTGRNEADYYRLNLTRQQEPLYNLGSADIEFGMKKNKCQIVKGRSFSFFTKAQVMLNQYRLDLLFKLLDGIVKVMDPQNLKQLKPVPSEHFNTLSHTSKIAIDTLNTSFPRFVDFIDQYFIIDSLLKIKNANTISYTHHNLIGSFKFKTLAKDYPAFEKYVKRLHNLFIFELDAKTMSGNTIMRIAVDSQKECLRFLFYTRGGKVIPFNSQGQPVFSEAYGLTELTDFKYKIKLRLFFDIYNLKFNTDNIIIKGHYQKKSGWDKVSYRMDQIQHTTVKGRAGYILPPWLLNFFVPGDIDDVVYDFMKVLHQANHKEGTIMELDWDSAEPDRTILSFLYKTELLDNFFIRFGLRIFQDKFILHGKTLQDVRRFLVNGIDATVQDLKHLKHKKGE